MPTMAGIFWPCCGVEVLYQTEQRQAVEFDNRAFEITPDRFFLAGSLHGDSLLALDGPKGRVIGQMQIDSPVQLAIFDDHPTPAAHRVIFLLA